MQEKRRLIQTSGAMGDDNARQIAALSKDVVDAAGELQPMRRSDRGAGNVGELFGFDASVFPGFRNGCHNLRDGTPDLVTFLGARIFLLARDRPARGKDKDSW